MSKTVIDTSNLSPSLSEALDHYDHALADLFYKQVWGGDDIFIGLGWHDDDNKPKTIADACRKMVDHMVALIPNRQHIGARLLDLGAGYGASARRLAREYGFRVDCLNLSEAQNAENRRLNRKYGLDDKITVFQGNFESLAFSDGTYDVVWSQDAFLHSDDRAKILREIDRVLQSGGDIVFTDILEIEDCPEQALEPVLARFGLKSLATPSFYRGEAGDLGWRMHTIRDISPHLVKHYRRVIQEVESNHDELSKMFEADYLAKGRRGMEDWIDAGERGYLRWGMFHFGKV
uniref:Sarcosine/dimethylglycine N-methyltransferase n=1 Tax=Candidatus Kentrum sp. LPFa TaxID=2126335 RepID=A0A450XHT5_9GAMM|nr:MAG: sarcosine/dimethylglycine N-methyltransferase [Candidatus Kentron sp. LPFa]VFK18088.1 MAG: sarcosine/dimethylglycine N-methyltransferase [Candidatus Kentron sp. LPFa]VFK28728.1 MAG: sarcosine/dimethylglycine N-methyltransferase [Candidatus Kentron sp. LPFa]